MRTDTGAPRLSAAPQVAHRGVITTNYFSNVNVIHGLAIGVTLLFLCCGGTRTRFVPQRQRPGPSRIAAANSSKSDELSQSARRIAREIAELRGWDPRLAVTLETAGSSRLIAAIRADEESQITPLARQAEIEFLESFGFVPERFNFERDVTQRFSQDLLGLYCFTWRRILLTANRDFAAVESSMRHELVHAFQDKYYNIADRVRWQTDQGDRIAAIHSLAEGEAICVARQLEDPQHRGCFGPDANEAENPISGTALDSIPPAIRYALLSPYADGTRFVQHLLRHGGWKAVDLAWRGNLGSTHELLHPGDSSTAAVLALEAPGAAAQLGACSTEYLDTLGEQGLASLLFDPGDPGIGSKLAATLIGDRVGVWRCANNTAAAWRLRLAQPAYADRVARIILTSLGPALSELPKSGSCRQTRAGARYLLVTGHDIAITSVQKCTGEISQDVATSCQNAERWAKRLIGL